MNTHSKILIPSWLETPSHSRVSAPIKTRLQELPLGELDWRDFEKLCLRLVRREATVEYCHLYGKSGEKQLGIDIYALKKGAEKYTVYQCKRVDHFGPAKIKDAVSKFLEGEWSAKADTFVLCTEESLIPKKRADEFERQRGLLGQKGITLLGWDSSELSIRLKGHPDLVDDFFSREWVKAFCGEEQARSLGRRLDAETVAEFRKECLAFYGNVFSTHDPGLLIAPSSRTNLLLLKNRYVPPDVYERRSVTIHYPTEATEPEVSEDELRKGDFGVATSDRGRRASNSQGLLSVYKHRQKVEEWLASGSRSIILGGPGSGKSALLHFVAIDLLEESPRLALLAEKWGEYLPIWIPFGFWTKIISNSATGTCSLSDLLHSWLGSWDEERLWPLFKQALFDDRLLLLVDGLDEWVNESTAAIALQLLQVFITQRNVPAVVTSRLHGFDRLGMQKTGWRIGELSDFSTANQKALSRIWFAHRIRSTDEGSTFEEQHVERKADLETEAFLSELYNSTDLRELAKVPLLLCLLIYHRFHNARLPQSRFKAYDSLIEHLVSKHPQSRRIAAFLTDSSFGFTDDDTKRILALLAYHMQVRLAEGLVDHSEAVTFIEDYLKDCESGFGLGQHEARQAAKEVLEVGQNTIGLLVRKSPKEIGFFHRVFQEYLAAYHLSLIPLSDQLSVVEGHCMEPRWREVVLGLFQITRRSEDIKQFVDCIKTKSELVSAVDRYAIRLLLCETAFGEFNQSVSLARELAQEAFEQVELGAWMPHRERLLQHILDGLRSTKVKQLVQSKIRTWFPCRSRWRERVFIAMAKWPCCPGLVECLWKGMHDEELNNQRAAARALADLKTGDSVTGERVAYLARNAGAPRTRAVAIKSLMSGWGGHRDMGCILEAARRSMSPELRLVAALGKIQQNVQTEDDREELLRLGSREGGVDFRWRDDIVFGLVSGWSRSPEIKEACLATLRQRESGRQCLEGELALRVLLRGYPGDEDVAQFCVDEIKHEKYPFILLHFDAWRLLEENFKGHPRIVAAIDEWIPKQQYHEAEVSLAAMVGRTPKAKAELLSSLDSTFPHWPARALIEGWGMKDPEVAKIMKGIAFGPAAKASGIGHLLPKIIENKGSCRKRLIALLQDPESDRHDFVFEGIRTLGSTQDDSEVVDIVLNLLPSHESWRYWGIIEHLILGYSSDSRVKQLAMQELSERDGRFAAVAQTYGDDEQIRRKIIEIACPLPGNLRRIIARYLGEESHDEMFTMSLLKLYDHEQDEQVKTQMSISYYTRLKVSGQDTKAAVESLSRNIVCYGYDYEERRQAAFCGLVALGHLDVMVNVKERRGSDSFCAISVSRGLSPNIPLLRYIVHNWDAIKAALGEEFWPRINKYRASSLELWDAICMFADEYPSACGEALRFLEGKSDRTAKPNMLRFLGRVRPRSRLLQEYCLRTLCIGDDLRDRSDEEAVVAAELLGRHFGGDSDVLERILSGRVKGLIYDKVILALCEGWPESTELDCIFDLACKNKPRLSYAAYFQLICRKSSSDIVFDALVRELPNPKLQHRWPPQVIIRPVLRRLQEDNRLLTMLMGHLENNPTPSEKATIPKLISGARGVSSELRIWCAGELDRELSGTDSLEVGFDLIVGQLCPVSHSLLDVLSEPMLNRSTTGYTGMKDALIVE